MIDGEYELKGKKGVQPIVGHKILGTTFQRTTSAVSRWHCDVAVIGAGPYGLSVGAHLTAGGMSARVFGEPMEFWAKKMPEGMLLRSPRVASNLSDPDGAFTLEAYEAASKTAPSAPVPLDTFVEYGRWFRHQLGSHLDGRNVIRLDRDGPGFRLMLTDGEEVRARRVVIAAGIGPFRKKPTVFQTLPRERVTHCYEGRAIRKHAGHRVAVIGGGQSALESAALLHEAGAEVEVLARQERINWIGQHSWLHRMGPISSMLYSSHSECAFRLCCCKTPVWSHTASSRNQPSVS